MAKAEFDAIADGYLELHRKNIAASGDDPEYFARYKIADVAEDRLSRGLSNDGPITCVDFGAGIGASIPHLRHFFPNSRLVALDVSERSLEINRNQNGARAEYVAYDGTILPFEDGSVDVIVAACVFHHIAHDAHPAILREIRRVLKSGGDFYVFEHNPWNPLTLHAVNTCPFDENAELISGPVMARRVAEAGLEMRGPVYRYFFPAALAKLRPMEAWLRAFPIGAQYFVRGSKAA